MSEGKQKIEGIIIQNLNYSEHHKIIHIFTPNKGNLSAIAHGGRKIKSRFRGKLESLNWVEGVFQKPQRSNMLVIEELNVKQSFSQNLSFDTLWRALPFLKFFKLLHFSEEEENQKIFNMSLEFFKNLQKIQENENSARLLIYAFVLKTLLQTGMFPPVGVCSSCGTKLTHPAYLYEKEGIFICDECRINFSELLALSPDFLNFLIKTIYSRFNEIIYFINDNSYLEKLCHLLEILCYHYLGKKWKDFEPKQNPFSLSGKE